MWWYNSLERWNGKVILPSEIDGQLVTDASQIGWGGHYGKEIAQGFLDSDVPKTLKHQRIDGSFIKCMSLSPTYGKQDSTNIV